VGLAAAVTRDLPLSAEARAWDDVEYLRAWRDRVLSGEPQVLTEELFVRLLRSVEWLLREALGAGPEDAPL
jgi:hypothetical protein